MLLEPRLRIPTAVIGFSQGVACLSLYGVIFSTESKQLFTGAYVSALLGSLVELPAYLLMCPAADRLGRRPAFAGFLFLGALGLFVTVLSTPGTAVHSLAVLVARFASAGSSTVVFTVSAEQFPTACRNLGVGWGSSCGRIGAAISTQVLQASFVDPFLVFAVFSVAAGASVFLLEETLNKNLED